MISLLPKVMGIVGSAAAAFVFMSALHGSSQASAEPGLSREVALVVSDKPISDDALRWASSDGITIKAVAERAGLIDAKDAVARAETDFAFLDDGDVRGVQLAELTDDNYGEQLEQDQTKPSRIKPKLDRALVWMVEYSGFVPFVSSPMSHDGISTRLIEPQANGRMLVAVDAVTGEAVWGVQY